MNDALYQQGLKTLAQAGQGTGTLARKDGEALRDNPFCGDRVHIEIAREGGVIVAFAQQTKACLLCRAAAAMLAVHATGLSPSDVDGAATALRQLLATGVVDARAWPEMALFAPVAAHRSRHGCVLLPIETLLQALAAPAA